MIKKHYAKKWLAAVLLFVTAFALTGCSSSKATPYGSLSNDNVIISNGTFSLGEKDLYDSIKINGYDTLVKLIDKAVLKEYIDKYLANPADTRYDGYFKKIVNSACYGDNLTEENIEDLPLTSKQQAQLKFLDTIYSSGYDVSYTKSTDGLYDIFQEQVRNYYLVDIAKQIYAYEYSLYEWNQRDEFQAEDEDDRDGESQQELIIDKWEEEYEGQSDVQAIIVRFANLDEYQETIKIFRMRSVGGAWYHVPASVDYATYEKKAEDKLTSAEVLARFFVMYDYIYSHRSNICQEMGWTTESVQDIAKRNVDVAVLLADFQPIFNNIVAAVTDSEGKLNITDAFLTALNAKDTNNDFTVQYDEYESFTDIVYALYSSLATKSDNEDKPTSFQQYSTSYTSYSGGYFMAYKLTDGEDKALYDEDGNIVDEDFKAEIIEDIIEYYQSIKDLDFIMDELYNGFENEDDELVWGDFTVLIYDQDLETLYKVENSKYKATSKSSTDLIAAVKNSKGEVVAEIKVDDFAQQIIKSSGTQKALDLALDNYIANNYNYSEQYTEAQINKELKSQYENAMAYFKNDYFSSYGLPNSIGKKAFMKIYFNATNREDAINNYFRPQFIKSLFLSDVDAHYELLGVENMDIYSAMTKYVNEIRDEFFSVTYRNLLFYVDMDADEEVDDINDYIASLTGDELIEFKSIICELADKAADYASKGTTQLVGLESFVNDYAAGSRYTGEWAKFKQAGILVKFETSSTTTNSDVNELVEEFGTRLEEVYNNVSNWSTTVDTFEKGTFNTTLDYIKGQSFDSLLKTEFGFHLVLYTSAAVKSTAEFTQSDDTKVGETYIYQNIKYSYTNESDEVFKTKTVENAYSDSANVSRNQFEIYVRDQVLYGKNVNLYSKVYTSVSEYGSAVYTRYTSNNNRTLLCVEFLTKNNYKFGDADLTSHANQLVDITKRMMDNYADEADNTYAGWFADFKYTSYFA